MRTVYRVETSSGAGPYEHGPVWSWPVGTWNPFTRHPEPDRDGIPLRVVMDGHRLYGFASLAQARRWFAGAGAILGDAGYRLSAYEVPDDDVVDGGRQVAYLPDRATLVGTHHALLLDATDARELVPA